MNDLSAEMTLQSAALALMPMHLLIDGTGCIQSMGTTLARLTGPVRDFTQAFSVAGEGDAAIPCGRVDRVFLQMRAPPGQQLRGRAIPLAQGGVLMNLGFGIGVIEAIRNFDLTDRDFAPADLAIELLFLHEANSAMTAELSRANLRLEEERSKAETEAFTDPLTGLLNRRGLGLSFPSIHQADGAFAVAALDLDHFKALNDTHGHASGDEMLREVAARLRSVTRSVDVVARAGGDEFILLLPGIADRGRLLRLGGRMIDMIEQPARINGTLCRVSASVGFALSSDFRDATLPQMIAAADAALYAAKRGGRGQVRIAEALG